MFFAGWASPSRVKDGRVLLIAAGSHGCEAGIPMEEGAIVRIASQTKAEVIVVTLMLQKDARPLVSEPMGAHLPEWRQTKVAVPSEAGGHELVTAERAIAIRLPAPPMLVRPWHHRRSRAARRRPVPVLRN